MTAPAPAPAPGTSQPPGPEPGSPPGRRRLHPLTPLVRGARMLVVAVAALSWQGYAELGPLRWLLTLAVLLCVALLLSLVSWLFTGYEVAGRELRVTEGVLWRRHRTIPLERLQAVDVVRPLLARLTGLAELRLEVIGAHHSEAPLAFLTVGHAEALRDRLLRLAGRTATARTAPVVAATAGPPPYPDDLIFAGDNGRLLLAQLLTVRVWVVPLLALTVLAQFAAHPLLTFVGVASTITALIGVFVEPVRRVLADWHFRVLAADGELRLTHGLVETRSQTLPVRRVQAVEVRWPLLWRMVGWVTCRFEVAGYGAHDRQAGVHVNQLVPVATPEAVRLVVGHALPGLDVATVRLVPAPVRARWIAPLRQRTLGAGLTGTALATRDGVLTRRLVLVPYARVQSVRLVQGRVQRVLGLASVHADTAGGLHAVAHHRDLADARALAAAVVERARGARRADRPARAGVSGPETPAPPPVPAGARPAPEPRSGPVPHPDPEWSRPETARPQGRQPPPLPPAGTPDASTSPPPGPRSGT